jgi:glycosyltransferase involved in cell wall biosynthesis
MRTVMLVSANADRDLRLEIEAGTKPVPEFIALERDYGVRLLDWSRLKIEPGRSAGRSIRHAAAGLRAAAGADALFSDGEHIGIPLGIALEAIGPARPHVVLGHHLTSRSKPWMLRGLRHMGITRVLVHSRVQLKIAIESLGFSQSSAAFVPYYADARFWCPQPVLPQRLIVSAGREHRDYATLAAAVKDLPVQTVIAAGSLFSPAARCRLPEAMPANVTVGMRSPRALRELYAQAEVVVVPLIPSDFQAGVTTILEAMAMAKPVVVTATEGQGDIVIDGETGVLVPPDDAPALRAELRRLLADPAERRRLGANAREAVLARFNLPIYAAMLHRHLVEVARADRRAA